MTCSALRQVSSPLVLLPAYGARYHSVKEIQAAWERGEDFKIYGWSGYASVRNLDALRHESSSITIIDPSTRLSFIVG